MGELPVKLRILCCNVRRNLQEDIAAGNGWDDRKELCLEIICKQQADVICLQECGNEQYVDFRNRLTEYECYCQANPDSVFHPVNTILFAGNRFELVTAGGFWLSETPHVAGSSSWDSARPRFAIFVQLKERSSGLEFRVWDSHFDHIGQLAREKQAEMIIQASEAFPPEMPQLFAADCNADAANPAVQKLMAGGWTDTWTAIHGLKDPGYTFHAFLGPRFAEERPDRTTGKIDWIFSRGPVKALAAEILREGFNGRYPSDHYFLSADVALG